MSKKYYLASRAGTNLIGLRTVTSLAAQGVPGLWQKFGPRVKEIADRSEGMYNVTCYRDDMVMEDFTPLTRYEAWAAVKVDEGTAVPEGLEALKIPMGTYAVFTYKGLPQDFSPVADQIFKEWLPTANLGVDNTRPHFEYLPPGYRTDDPEAEEEVWIPVIIAP